MENLAERLARGETITPEEYEAVTRERQVPVEVQKIKSVYGVPCSHCKLFVTVFECFVPEIKLNTQLCLKCISKIESKAIPVTAIGAQDAVTK
jgi:hypothetical protein